MTDVPSLANMMERRVSIFSNVDVDRARVGKNKYGFRRYLENIVSKMIKANS